jgi:structural maintenance of chromosome 2
MEKELAEIHARRKKEMEKGGKVQALTEAVNALERELVKVKTQLEIKDGIVADDAKRVDAAKKGVKDVEDAIVKKREGSSAEAEAFAELKAAYDAGATELARTEELLQTLLTGLSSSKDDEGAGGYMGALAEAKARLAAAGTEAEQAKVKIGLAEREIKDKEPRAKKAEKEGEGLLKELAAKRKAVETLRARLDAAEWDDEKERGMLERQAEHGHTYTQLAEKRDTLKSRIAAIDFAYSDPYPGFDRSQVHGMVATLIDLDEANYESSTALEICAGGKMYNVVVQDEKIGKALLEKGQLRKRVTIIPLNKINAFRINAEKIANAKKAAPGKVNVALDLVGYEGEVSRAMEYVFGDVFICKDKQAAQAVTFNRAIGVRSVTLDGDVYDPSGTLSGGAAPSSSGLLVKVQELRALERQMAEHKRVVDEVSGELARSKKAIDQWRKDRREMEIKTHEVKLLEDQVNGSNATKVRDRGVP